MKKVNEKDKLRLVQWYNDRCPPIDFNDQLPHVIALINEVLNLRRELKVTDDLLDDRQKLLDAIPECPQHGKCIPHALEWIETAKNKNGR